MIISDSPERNTSITLEVERIETYQENFELNLVFSTLNNANWIMEEEGYDYIQISTRDEAAILHVKELLEYHDDIDTIRVYIDDNPVEAEVSFTQGRVYLGINLCLDDMDLYESTTNICIS
mgnify:CR=1 FL=1